MSSSYTALCLSHDPGIELPTEHTGHDAALDELRQGVEDSTPLRVSQLIARLTEIQAVCGDVPVRSYPYAGEDWALAVAPEPLLDDQCRPFVVIDGRG
ncbi:hypothetical protein ACFWR6_06755 [Streptomyces griseus]|uniref:hypothetical protein n=1 Tax=Streptomyces griseus TaxID=1911 RepID=UPI00364C7D5B